MAELGSMETLRAQKTFERSTTMLDALALHPRARWVFAAYHLNGCVPCPRSNEETIEEVALAYKLPIERLLRDLNSLFGTR